MSNLNLTYISLAIVDAKKTNPAAIMVSSEYLANGRVFELSKAAIPVSATISSIEQNDLQPEVSSVYPFKVVPTENPDGSVIIYTPNIQTFVTASQNYYTKLKFERYEPSVLRSLDRGFLELQLPTEEILPDTPGE